MPDRLAQHGGHDTLGGPLDELEPERSADAVAHVEELLRAEVVHQPQLVVREGAPGVAGGNRSRGFAAVRIALIHRNAAEVALERFHRVEHRGGPVAHAGVQAPAGSDEQWEDDNVTNAFLHRRSEQERYLWSPSARGHAPRVNGHRAFAGAPVHGGDPDHAALWDVGLGAQDVVERTLHALRVDAPAGLHGDVLHAVDGVGARHAGDAGVRAPLPERFAGLAVERTEVAVVGAAGEDEAAAGREYRSPVMRFECAHPHLLAGVHVPSLDLTDVLGAFGEIHPDVLDLGAQPELARLVRLGRAQQRAAEIFVGRDVEVAGLRVVGGRRPVLAAPQRRTEWNLLAGDRLLRLVVLRAAGLRIDLGEHRLLDVGLGVNEADSVGSTLQHPEIAVARGMHQALDRTAVALDVHQQRRRHLVPVPGIIPVVLVIRADLARVGVEREHRGRIEVVARALIAHPLRTVAGAPVGEIQLGIVVAGDPDRRPARLPRIALPRLRAGLARRRDREGLPRRLAAARVQRLDEAADAQLTAGDTDHDLPPRDQGRQGHVVATLVVLDRLVPHHLARLGVERDDVRIERSEIDLVFVQAHAAVGWVQLEEVVGQLALVTP